MVSNTVSVGETKKKVYAEDLVIKVQKELLLAARSEDGYTREFDIPDKLGKYNYTISLSSGEVTVILDGVHYVRKIPSINGNIIKGTNIIFKRENVVNINQSI